MLCQLNRLKRPAFCQRENPTAINSSNVVLDDRNLMSKEQNLGPI